MNHAALVTAAVLVIGDEILSGRTQDVNVAAIARFLAPYGIDLMEVRIVPDIQAEIVAAVNALRRRYSYVFTTGGIGPTHDDITADAIGAAFGVPVEHHPEAMALLAERYKPGEFNERRQQMARVPRGASLIRNSVSVAPGFQVENVFVLAGVPKIMLAMLDDIGQRLARGTPVISRSLTVRLPEGRIADPLAAIQRAHPAVTIGSYPFFADTSPAGAGGGRTAGTTLVIRGRDQRAVQAAAQEIEGLAASMGVQPETAGNSV
jgi:molybdenum cofactor synthesis domain-containing protein